MARSNLRHSERARKGTRDQWELIIKTIEADIKNIEREIKLYEKYAVRGLKFAEKILPKIMAKRDKRQRQLEQKIEKQEKYRARGLI